MARPFTPFSFRSAVWIALGAAIFTLPLLGCAAANRWLGAHRDVLVETLSDHFGAPVEVEKLHYRLFSGIWIDGFSMKNTSGGDLPSPVTVEHIRLQPSVALYAPLGLEWGWKVMLVRPDFSLRANLKDLFEIGRFLAQSPQHETRVGPFRFRRKLTSIEARAGYATLLSSTNEEPWKQEYANVRVFIGRHWLKGEKCELSGRVADNPLATFHIQGRILSPGSDAVESDLKLTCKNFSISTLAPHIGASFNLPGQELNASVKLRTGKNGTFFSNGRLSFPRLSSGKNFIRRIFSDTHADYRYRLSGTLDGRRCDVEKMWFEALGMELYGHGKIRLEGSASTFHFDLKSSKIPFEKFKAYARGFRLQSGIVKLRVVIAGSTRRVAPYVVLALEDGVAADPSGYLTFTKMTGRLRLTKNRLALDDLWAFAGNVPIRLHGSVTRFHKPHVRAYFATYPGQVASLKAGNQLHLETGLDAREKNGKWKIHTWFKHTTFDKNRPRHELWSVSANGFSADLRAVWVEKFLRGARVECRSLVVRHFGDKKRFDFAALQYPATFISGRWPVLRADGWASAAGGNMTWHAASNVNSKNDFSWRSSLDLTGASVTQLLRQLGRRWPAEGTASVSAEGSGSLRSSRWTGSFALTDGRLGPFEALEKLADRTGIEPLRGVAYQALHGKFDIAGPDISLHALQLESPQARLGADLKIKNGERMAGLVSARFPESALERSSKLRWLLHFVGGKDWIDFDFRVAGSFTALRVQWLTGEFKRKIESRIPSWLRNHAVAEFERRIGTQSAA